MSAATPSLCVNLVNIGDEIQDAATVSPLMVIPSDELEEILVQSDTRFRIERAGVRIALHITRNDLIFRVCENT